MPEDARGLLRAHEDAARFLAALNVTAASTGFAPRLVEKDYICTVLLHDLTCLVDRLVFKGGTCLAKVHGEFYRLSEDLDFMIPVDVGASRTHRRELARGLKQALGTIEGRLARVRVRQSLTGANRSTQYVATLSYDSVLREAEETVKIEVGLREPLLTPVVRGRARTLVLDPVTGRGLVPEIEVPTLCWLEAMAEKLRAALTRRQVAIRDFYDVDHAVRRLGLDPADPVLLDLVRRKLAMPGNDAPCVSSARLDSLRRQVETELSPMLRPDDFDSFDLERAWSAVVAVAGAAD